MRKIYIQFLSAVFLFSTLAAAQSNLKIANIGDLKLDNGQTINNCKIGYRTFGTLNGDKSNAMLFPTWFGGTSAGLVNLVGRGKLADSTKYFVITVDALGDGISSSPSNSKEQPLDQFPKFNIRDMVNSQHKLLTSVLGINHLYCVIGGSMGGMQTFEWITHYPDFMDNAIPYVGSPRLAPSDLLLWQAEVNSINQGRMCNLPDSTLVKAIAAIQSFAIQTPAYVNSHVTRDGYKDHIKSLYKSYSGIFNSYDWESQLYAMMAHNVSAPFGGSMSKAAAAVKAKVLIIVSLQDHIVNPQPAIEFAKLINAQVLKLNNDCGHLAPSCEMQKVVNTIENFLAD